MKILIILIYLSFSNLIISQSNYLTILTTQLDTSSVDSFNPTVNHNHLKNKISTILNIDSLKLIIMTSGFESISFINYSNISNYTDFSRYISPFDVNNQVIYNKLSTYLAMIPNKLHLISPEIYSIFTGFDTIYKESYSFIDLNNISSHIVIVYTNSQITNLTFTTSY